MKGPEGVLGDEMRTEGAEPVEKQPVDGPPANADQHLSSRRAMLRIAGLGGAAVVTIRPGIAQAATSVLSCSIPVPDRGNSDKWIKADGQLVSKNANGAFPPPDSPLAGEDVKNSLKYGASYPGHSTAETEAYNAYIRKLTSGQQGYTCYASLQSPSRQ